MKKILVTDEVTPIISKEKSFLDREGVNLLMVATNDDVLPVHRAEKTNVIITTLNMPGMTCEELCSAIRSDDALRKVSIIMICPNNAADIERSAQCKANLIVTMPVDPAELLEKVRQLLDISWRESYRVLVSVSDRGERQGNAILRPLGKYQHNGNAYRSGKGPRERGPVGVLVLSPRIGADKNERRDRQGHEAGWRIEELPLWHQIPSAHCGGKVRYRGFCRKEVPDQHVQEVISRVYRWSAVVIAPITVSSGYSMVMAR